MTIPSGTKFIGISQEIDLTQKRSASINEESAGYTVEEIVSAGSNVTSWTATYTALDASFQDDRLIGKTINQILVSLDGVNQKTVGTSGNISNYDADLGSFDWTSTLPYDSIIEIVILS